MRKVVLKAKYKLATLKEKMDLENVDCMKELLQGYAFCPVVVQKGENCVC